MSERPFDGLLLDWVGTIAHYSSIESRFVAALAELDRDPGDAAVLVSAWQTAKASSGWLEAEATMDLSSARYEAAVRRRAEVAGFDDDLTAALWRRYDSADSYSIPADVAPALQQIAAAGLRVGVVSDFHRDLRADAAAAGLYGLIDHWSISCEVGVQKPDPTIFRHALDGIGVAVDRALMVGDRPETDGGAPACGIAVLLVPPNEHWLPRVAAMVAPPA